MQNSDENTPKPDSTYRSRWGRFSPSMGWKAFWSEIIIVILGVLIALAANETVQNWNWRNKVQDGENRLRVDVERAFINAAELYVTVPCVDSQLSNLTNNLLKSGEKLTQMPIYKENIVGAFEWDFVVRLPNRPYSFSTWETLLADGTAAHFSPTRQEAYAYINFVINRFQNENTKNQEATGRFDVMAFPINLDTGVRKDLMVDIQEQKRRNIFLSIYAQRLMVRINEMKSQPKDAMVNAELNESGTVQFCKQHNLPLADWRDALKP